MGPSTIVDGEGDELGAEGRRHPLQWGRQRSSTESWVTAAIWVSFNVASMGPSTIADGEGLETGAAVREATLQWGRQRSSTESAELQPGAAVPVLASMGPSTIVDGEMEIELRGYELARLQWAVNDRRRRGARRSPWPRATCGFNGAVNDRRRRGEHRIKRDVRIEASMGPSTIVDGEIRSRRS